MFLIKSEGGYTMIHDKLFDILCAYFGKHYQQSLIRFAQIKVLYERILLRFANKQIRADTDIDNLTIFLDRSYEDDYFTRILDDIQSGNVIEAFYCQQMDNVDFRARLISFMESPKYPVKKLKSLLHKREEVQKGGLDTAFHIVCALDYEDLFRFFLNFSENIDMFASDEFPPLHQTCFYGNQSIVNLFIKNGADVNSSGLNGLTPIIWACLGEQLHIVELLLLNNADVNLCVAGRSAIFEACSIQNSDILNTLIRYGADINSSDHNGDTPIIRSAKNGLNRHVEILLSHCTDCQRQDVLIEACKNGSIQTVILLIQRGVSLNNVDNNGMTSMAYACECGHIKLVEILYEEGCQLRSIDGDDVLPLEAACRGRQKEIIEYLVELKCDVNGSSDSGWTALMEACVMSDKGLMALLLDNGASINQSDDSGKSPLMLACELNDDMIVHFLMNRGANINQKDHNGVTALILACKNRLFRLIRMHSSRVHISHVLEELRNGMAVLNWLNIESIDILDFLLELGLDVNLPNSIGQYLLVQAVEINNEFGLNYLLNIGANPNVVNNQGQTPLLIACIKGRFQLIPMLVSSGAHVYKSDNCNKTPLLVLSNMKSETEFVLENRVDDNSANNAISNNLEMTKFNEIFAIDCLLDMGLNINVKDVDGKTSFILACENRNCRLIQFLINEGVEVNESDNSGNTALHAVCTNEYHYVLGNKKEISRHIGHVEEAEHNNVSVVSDLLSKGLEINAKNNDRQTPLIDACINRNLYIARCLVQYGADMNLSNSDGETPLHICSSYSSSLVETLIRAGAHVNQCDSKGITPLMIACSKLQIDVIDILLKNGADVNCTDYVKRESALDKLYEGQLFLKQTSKQKSEIEKRKTIARKLLTYGLTKTYEIESKDGPVRVMITKDVEWRHIFSSLDELDCFVRCILTHDRRDLITEFFFHDAFTFYSSALGTSPFFEFIRLGYSSLAIYLIETGTDINEVNDSGLTHLITSIQSENIVVTEYLIKKGVDLNSSDQEGRTPLRWAVLINNFKLVEVLINSGADVNQGSRNGRTLLMWTYRTANIPMARLLLNKGADLSLQDAYGINAIFWALFYNTSRINPNLVYRNDDNRYLSELPHADEKAPNLDLHEMKIDFFNDQLSTVNRITHEYMQNPIFVNLLNIDQMFETCSLQDIAAAVILFLKEGGFDYLTKLKDDEFNLCLDCLLRQEFFLHSLLQIIFKENKSKLPCTFGAVRRLVAKRKDKFESKYFELGLVNLFCALRNL